MPPEPAPPIAPDRRRSQLERIAAHLGVPVAKLSDGAGSKSFGSQTAELLRLWSAIEDPEKRRLLLDEARRLVGADEPKGSPTR